MADFGGGDLDAFRTEVREWVEANFPASLKGKPNPMMFRSALNQISAHSESTAMVGDRMDTDIISGIEAGIETALVLSGVTQRADLARFGFSPDYILDHVGDLPELLAREH